MKKNVCILFMLLILCFGMAFPAFADTEGFADKYYRVMDMADLLTDSEEETLIETLDEISIRQSMDVVVATTNDLEGFSVQEYADILYEQCSFGYGADYDGLLLLISMEDRDWYISTCGYGITVFTDAGISYIGKQIKPDLSEGNYAAAFQQYAALCDTFITQAKTDAPYDNGNLPRGPLSPAWLLVSLVIGFVLAKVIVGQMKNQLKTVRYQPAANSYVRSDSLQITNSRDTFLYNTVTKTQKAESDSQSSGSSTHTSSSGTTHGGGGGKF